MADAHITDLEAARWVRDHSNTHADIATAVLLQRLAAHEKHGENSIEDIPLFSARWYAILGEEFGEVGHELTYDAVPNSESLTEDERLFVHYNRLRRELVDLSSVAFAWINKLNKEISYMETYIDIEVD